jgi:hypothetical protein
MFFAMMIMFFIFMRVTHGRRRHFVRLQTCNHWHGHRRIAAAPRSEPTLSVFDRLKQQYVQGDIDVEEYEARLDVLLRTPETRKAVP